MKRTVILILVTLFFSSKSVADSLLSSGDYQQVFIELTQPSLVEMVTDYQKLYGKRPSPAEQKAYTQQLKSNQAHVVGQVAEFDTRHIKSFTTTLNGIKCSVPARDIHKIKALDGVKGIRTVNVFKGNQATLAPTSAINGNYLKAIGVDKLHEQGFTGKGQVIAIIDTGVNYSFKGLGGTVDPKDAATVVNDETMIEPGTFPNDKVIGGIDLSPSRFDNDRLVIKTDPDPHNIRDNHGTYVAAFAAGSAGNSFAPGVAPDAKIIAIKVSGGNGSGTSLIADAIDFALDPNQDGSIDDHVDVINMSLGTGFGAVFGLAAEQLAVERAAMLGVMVVAAAGNDGHREFNMDLPAAWPSVIGVGNSRFKATNSGEFIFSPDASTSVGPHSVTGAFKPDITAPGSDLPVLGISTVSGTSFSSPIIAGFAAVLRQKHPDFTLEQIKSLMVNSTRPVRASFKETAAYSPLYIQGVGVMQAQEALNLTSIAAPSTISFGVLELEGSETFSQEITVMNTSSYAKEYRAVVEPNTTYTGLRYDVTPRFTLPAHSQKAITLRMRVDPQILSESVTALSHVDGWVVITEGDERLSSGYSALVKPTSNIQLKDFNGGSVVFNRSGVKGQTKRYLAVDYSEVTVFDETTNIQKAVPQLGVAINEQDGQYTLELLVAYDSTSLLPFSDGTAPLTINADFISQTGSTREFITVGDRAQLLSYSVSGSQFASGFALELNGFNNNLVASHVLSGRNNFKLGERAEHIGLDKPLNSRHMLIRLPLDHKPEGDMTFNVTMSSRRHYLEPFIFEAQAFMAFSQTDFPLYSGAQGRLAKVKHNSLAQSQMWLFPQNTSKTSIAIERQVSLLPDVVTVQPSVNIDATALPTNITQNTVTPLSIRVQSATGSQARVFLRAPDSRLTFSDEIVTLETDRSRTLAFSIDASRLPVGEVFSSVVEVVRVDDNHVLSQVPVAFTIMPLVPSIFFDGFSDEVSGVSDNNSLDIGDVTVGQPVEFSAFIGLTNLSDTLLPLTVNTRVDDSGLDVQFAESSLNAIDLFWVYTPTTLGRFTATLWIDLGDVISAIPLTVTGNAISDN